jgi:hypothetical protein
MIKRQQSKVKGIVLALLIIVLPFSVFSQKSNNDTKAENNFATLKSADEVNNYFLVDMTTFPGFFEKAYFLDLIFADSKLVVNNSNISGSTLELFSDRINDTEQLLKSLEEYCKKALSASTILKENEKQELVAKYNKYR